MIENYHAAASESYLTRFSSARGDVIHHRASRPLAAFEGGLGHHSASLSSTTRATHGRRLGKEGADGDGCQSSEILPPGDVK